MGIIAIEYDDSLPFALCESPNAFEHEAVFLLALKLFELGRISAGKAAAFCKLSKPEFLWRTSQMGMACVKLDVDQIESEIDNA